MLRLGRQDLFRLGWAISFRRVSTMGSEKPVFITTPIFYVNDKPHIGHLYTGLLADALGRWFRMKGKKVFVSTGTDEHGLKIQKEAASRKMTEKEHCDTHSNHFRSLFDRFEIKYDRFIRTTEDDHKSAVASLWNTLDEKGFLQRGTYSGWYCTSDEQFLTDEDVILPSSPDGVAISKLSGREVEKTEESNILFLLASQKEKLAEWVKDADIIPKERKPHLVNAIQKVSDRLSVTRDAQRVQWGIRCPSDDSQTLYVWLDALTNYLTVTGYPNEDFKKLWPPDYQILGKDIINFHCIYWPSFLMAAGIEIPKRFICHAHWTKERKKMSKSIKNIIDPMDCLDTYSVDMMRFYLLMEGGILDDGDFSFTTLKTRVNGDLCNHYGNLLSRSTSNLINPSQTYPSKDTTVLPGIHQKIISSLQTLPDTVQNHYEAVQFGAGVREIFSVIRDCNVFFEENAPWKLVKSGDTRTLNQVLYTTYETLRICTLLLQPVMPSSTILALDRLTIPEKSRTLQHAQLYSQSEVICGNPLPQNPSVLFSKIK